ncbi:c-type cytochrome domain-containing protein [Dyadobacter sp. CY356]|uniref:c-type cytochrome domain-containing protein n=1 Tax=Dyadobacter sp. CY356 TaxID=2906442 RepID=UPI001F1B3020|nr:c-type cytochrome domain-containing protein [Dyadobacter sp. CY356]MCF0059552.1 ribonuclease inhibitor [Dyadobacter sp. CY356]
MSTLLQASDWTYFIGRFHPVLVHLPIGFLLIAALLEIGKRIGKISVSDSSISFILFWSAIGATMACIAGYLLSLGGGYDEELLSDHQWQGIGVAVFAWIAWLLKSGKILIGSAIYLPALGLSTLLTFTAGHDGGSLTHGDGYLTQYTPEPFRSLAGIPPRTEDKTEIKPITDINQAIVYKDIVQPILEMRCVQCHNANKQKGGLRMDNMVMLLKGGEDGPVFVSGKALESAMIKRCLLPESDDDHMPPKGKPQLSESQITLLSWWIEQGASADKKVSDLKISEQVKPALTSLTSGSGSENAKSADSPVLSLQVPTPNEKALEAVKKAGLLVMPISHDKNLLEVSAVNASAFGDQQINLFSPLSEQIIWLKLGGTKVTDTSVKELGKLKNLNKLHLEYTDVTDAGLTLLKDLQYLEYINLVGTKVTDAGLRTLASSKSLKNIYIWKSAVTENGVAEVQKLHPDLHIINGFNEAKVAEFLKAGDTLKQAEISKTK